MIKRVLLWGMTVALWLGSASTTWAKSAPTPDVPDKAGRISALLPVAKIVRGEGKTAVTSEAKRGDELVWNDLIKTEKGGRARITLTDQSILSLGSQAELRIVKHDARAQQTDLQMTYGRVRAQVANITRDGGSFKLRTPTAVAGVIGTDFGVDSSLGGDTFVCLTGAVQVSNADPNVTGAVQCSAGQTTTVQAGKAPTTPKPASLQQLQQLIADTEPAIISSIVPAASLPGFAFDSTIAGSKMGKVASVAVGGGSGVSASLKRVTDNSIQVHVLIDASASAGQRTLTLVKETGASSATVFTVLGMPSGDPKKGYLEIIQQMRSAGEGELSAFLTGAQQAADQVSQQVSQANEKLPRPLDLGPLISSLSQEYEGLSNNVKGDTDSIDKATQDAANTFSALYDPAYQDLFKHNPNGKPDAKFNETLTAAFTKANAILVAVLQSAQKNLNGSGQVYDNNLKTIEQTWLQNINNALRDQQSGSLPKVNALESTVELGNIAVFNVSGSKISSYQWTLCRQDYHPSGFGQPLQENAPACNAMQGFTSANPDFEISTCSLQPGYYYVRLATTDTSNKLSQMDLRLTVLQPSYPAPSATVRALADAYTSLQLSQFLRYFDSAQFNGYTVLSENIRRTMQSLASMSISLRVSQENVACNDATVRADWQQNYSFLGDPHTVYSQTEQLSVRMQRAPGVGWLINDFQGDNGKVQGIPGPQTLDAAAPDLVITGTTIDGSPLFPGMPLALAPGQHTIELEITNHGTAALTSGAVLPVVLSIQDSNGNATTSTSTVNAAVPSPMASGSTAHVTATLNVPSAAGNLSLVVQVNPACQPPESSCGTQNHATYPLELGFPDFTANFIPTATVNGIVGRQFRLAAVSVNPSPYPVAMTVAYNGLPAGLTATSTEGNTTNVNGTLIAGTPSAVGSITVSATASAGGVTKNVTGSATIAIGSEISITSTTPPTFIAGGKPENLTLNVTGGVFPLTLALALPAGFTTTSRTVKGNISTQTLMAPGPVTWPLMASLAATAGNNLTALVTATDAGIPTTSTPPGQGSYNAAYSVVKNVNYSITGFAITGHTKPPFTQANAFQVGEVAQFDVTVTNTGNVTSDGTVTVSLDCGNPAVCRTPLTASGPAPASGNSTVLHIPLNFDNFPVASYTGSISLTSDPAGADISDPVAIPYDVVDFTIANAGLKSPQNLLIGGSATLAVSVAVEQPSGNTFGIAITPSGDNNIVFTPATQISARTSIAFPLTVKAGATQGTGSIRFDATNHGVTKSVSVPYVLFSANLSSTSLFVNDAANPLPVPVAAGAQSPDSYPRITLKMNGNYDTSDGGSSISFIQPNCGTFSLQGSPEGSIFPGDQFDIRIYAASGNTCPAGTPIVVTAAIPQTVPPLSLPVYTLYVKPSGLPQLSVESATPARDVSNGAQPWLSGEPLDWKVVVRNSGSGPSAGNERVSFKFNSADIGQGIVPEPIPAGQTVALTIHTVAPDYPEDSPVSYADVRVIVQHDSAGDLNPNDSGYIPNVAFSNWGIGIISQNGTSDATPLNLSPFSTSGTVAIAVKNPANFNSNLNLSLVAGSYSSGQLNAPAFSPNILNSAGTSMVTVSYKPAILTNGAYFVQVLAQMKDGGIVTAQRQATIHVRLFIQVNFPAYIALTSDRNNIAPAGHCSSPGCQTIQINGPLPEEFTLRAGTTSHGVGIGGPWKADVSFTDSYMTITTPQIATIYVAQPGNTLPVRVKAADNPDGSTNVGMAKVNASISAIQSSFFDVRTPTPDPVGIVFDMNFNIGDLYVDAPSCVSLAPQSSSLSQLAVSLRAVNGFNVPTVQWEWQDANHVPVGASPLLFGQASGSSTFGGNGYSSLPTFNLQNVSNGIDGLQTYYFAVTVSNNISTATKYFPIDFDLSAAQTACPSIPQSFRAIRAAGMIRGSWGKAGLSAPNVGTVSSVRPAIGGKLPDLRVNSTDISFTPSIPKTGDTVAVRFRVSNVGDADATGVPVVLQVRGTTVASDTFDVPAGKTVLGGLEWAKAQVPARAMKQTTDRSGSAASTREAHRAARYQSDDDRGGSTQSGGRMGWLQAQIVIDPQKIITQKSTLAKSAPLAHFGLRDAAADAVTASQFGEQHALLIQSEGACGGLRFSFGAGACMASSDVTFTVEDLAKGIYKLEALNGVADLGIGNTSYVNASFGTQAVLQDGHTYAVQLRGDGVGLLTVRAVRNPSQLSEAAKRLFRQQLAIKVVNTLGSNSSAPETGDTAGMGSQPVVYFDIAYHSQE